MNKFSNIYLGSFSSSWQINSPHVAAILQTFVEQNQKIRESYHFMPFFFHALKGVDSLVDSFIHPFLVGANLVSWNQNRTFKLLRMVKSQYPHCLTLLGGNNVPKDDFANFFKNHPYVDFLIPGEGEAVFEDLLVSLLDQGSAKGLEVLTPIDGLVINKNGTPVQGGRRSLIRNEMGFIDYPSPYLTGKFEDYFDEIDRLGLFRGGVWETTRGCPYSCTFCDWGQLTNSKLRPIETDRIFSEIPYLVDHFDEIFFADSNFGILPRDLEITERLVDYWQRSKHRRLKTIHIGGAKNSNQRMLEIGRLLAKTSLTRAGMSMSLQTYNEKSLAAIKRQNIKPEKFNQLQGMFKSEGIPTYCDLIINCPEETYSSFKETLDFALEQDFTDLRMFTMDIYPNSEIIKDMERYKIKTKRHKIYHGFARDEDEYIDKVCSTNSMDEQETERLRSICRTIEVFHLGRWTHYISVYLNREKKIRFSEFYEKLHLFGKERTTSILGMAATEGFIKKFNKGQSSHFCGEFSPFGIIWKDQYFSKELFAWLCIAQFREMFYAEIREFFENWFGLNEVLEDLIKFNDSLIYSADYNPNTGLAFDFDYDWWSFFKEKTELRRVPIRLSFSDKAVGRKHESIPIKEKDPSWMRWAAGGRSYFVQRQFSYEYQDVSIEYLSGQRQGMNIGLLSQIQN